MTDRPKTGVLLRNGIPWRFVRHLMLILIPIAGMLAYFFVSQAGQDASAAMTSQRVTQVETVQRSHEKMLDELKRQSIEGGKALQEVQRSVTKIDTNQSLTREFLEKQLADIKLDLKELKK